MCFPLGFRPAIYCINLCFYLPPVFTPWDHFPRLSCTWVVISTLCYYFLPIFLLHSVDEFTTLSRCLLVSCIALHLCFFLSSCSSVCRLHKNVLFHQFYMLT